MRALTVTALLSLAACGGGGSGSSLLGNNGGTTPTPTPTPTTSSVGSVTILTPANQVGTNDAAGITITVIVKDKNNILLPNIPVTLSSNLGNLTVAASQTGTNGAVTATLTTSNVYTNGTITLNASAEGVSATPADITVSGTTINLNGATTAATASTIPYTMTLLDSNNKPISGQTIALTTTSGAVTPATVTTDTNGNANFSLSTSANATITATATGLNASRSLDVTVSPIVVQITNPAKDYPDNSGLLAINSNNTVSVNVSNNAAPAGNVLVSFSATRGTLSSTTAQTDASGNASVTLNSGTAGPAVITATYNGVTASRSVAFTAPTAQKMITQADPTIMTVNGSSTITAQLLDNNNNVVVGKTVYFSTNDTSGGQLSSASAITNQSGIATVTFTAGPNADTGFIITANEPTSNLSVSTPTMSVASKTASIAIGTDNTIVKTTPNYQKTYSIVVTDSNGAPIANQAISLQILPKGYAQGTWTQGTKSWIQVGNSGNPLVDTLATPASSQPIISASDACTSNDYNHDSIYEAGTDRSVVNNNGAGTPVLVPANVVTFSPANPTTDANGIAIITLTYPETYGGWVNVDLSATVKVLGTANTNTINFWLPVASADIELNNQAGPAGQPSPFGKYPAYATANCSIVP